MFQQMNQYQPPQAMQQPLEPKKTNWGKVFLIGCLIALAIIIILGLVCFSGTKKLIGFGIEVTFEEMEDSVLTNMERGTPEYEDAKYEFKMLKLLHKQKKVSLIDFADISDEYDRLVADGEINRNDAEILLESIREFNEEHTPNE